MPQYVNLTLNTGAGVKPEVLPIEIPNYTRTIPLNISIPSNSLFIPISVAALVYKNGTVYQVIIKRSDV